MPITPTYPGVYIEELPNLVHTITPAPTSIAVFIGYTHPFLTANPNTPVQLFSFADYQTNFGGFFNSPWQPDYVGQAVYQFFQNGGPTCYVVGIPVGEYWSESGAGNPINEGPVLPATADIISAAHAGDPSLTATALQPVGFGNGQGIQMSISISNGTASRDKADVVITYGSTVETYRQLAVAHAGDVPGPGVSPRPLVNGVSRLVTLAAANSPAAWPANGTYDLGYGAAAAASADIITAAHAGDPTLTATAKIPLGATPMSIAISNLQSTGGGTNNEADVVVTHGATVETYPALDITNAVTTFAGAASHLVSMAETNNPASWPTSGSPFNVVGGTPPDPYWTVIDPSGAAFSNVFATHAPLDKVPIFNLLVTPGITMTGVQSQAVAYAERKRAFYIMDTPSSHSAAGWDVDSLAQNLGLGATYQNQVDPSISTNSAVYYPWLQVLDPLTGAPSWSPPSGFVAGMFGKEDDNRGVWKSPAGLETALLGTLGVDNPNGVMSDNQQGLFNTAGLNCLRQFSGVGTVIYGARTTASTNLAMSQWKYVAVRRMALFIEQTLYANLTWAVFEGNSQPLWTALTQEVNAFMLSLFRQGAFAGSKPSEAFVVQCDNTTTTPFDIANGTVNILVGFAPLEPAEFVVVQIAQLAGQAQS